MSVLASGSKGNCSIISAAGTSVLVDAGLSCREILKRMAMVGEDPARLDAILITHEHLDHVAGLSVLARRLKIPVFFTEATHRAWMRMVRPRQTMTYAQWLAKIQSEKEQREAAAIAQHAPAHTVLADEAIVEESIAAEDAEALETLIAAATEAECEPAEAAKDKPDPAFLPAVEYFQAGQPFRIGSLEVNPFTIPHDAADPCGFVFHATTETIRMAIATDLGYMPPNVKLALKNVDVMLLESNHDLEMLKDGPYPWSVKQRVLSRVGHLSNDATAEYLLRDYDGGAHTIVLGHLSESNNLPELARIAAERALGNRLSLLGNRVVLAAQHEPIEPIQL
ncbi:MBL fold metallo-hydrolase [Granulicella cerasi]|uniref:MBL fold metallo-hydrolase n=1 Tax=Granulicella cerasi TaxID=741063 RepID=A0ABW1Z5X1_9BACT|nr:MBL fold metallo-hydrolase [Granulicella cerasi]